MFFSVCSPSLTGWDGGLCDWQRPNLLWSHPQLFAAWQTGFQQRAGRRRFLIWFYSEWLLMHEVVEQVEIRKILCYFLIDCTLVSRNQDILCSTNQSNIKKNNVHTLTYTWTPQHCVNKQPEICVVSWGVVPCVLRCPGGGWVLQHHPTDQTDQGEDRGEGLKIHAGIQRTCPIGLLWWRSFCLSLLYGL